MSAPANPITLPDNWPPRPAEIWQDRNGVNLIAREYVNDDTAERYMTLTPVEAFDGPTGDEVERAWIVNRDRGPLTLKSERAVLDGPRAELVRGLRELADWYEQHTEVDAPRWPTFGDSTSPETVANAAEALGVEVKRTPAGHLRARRMFGSLEFSVYHVPSAAMRAFEARNSYASVIQTDAAGGAR